MEDDKVTLEDFSRLEIRVAFIIAVAEIPGTDRINLRLDFGAWQEEISIVRPKSLKNLGSLIDTEVVCAINIYDKADSEKPKTHILCAHTNKSLGFLMVKGYPNAGAIVSVL